MRILISNDDGISAPGLAVLSRVASRFGEVYVCAPAGQCSAMSHKLTINIPLRVEEHTDIPGAVKAWSVTGTPADCVKLALDALLGFTPDLVLSGINDGYNAGYDIIYSGTVGAAMEGIMGRVPAIAVSTEAHADYSYVEEHLPDILAGLIGQDPGPGSIFSVNIPPLPKEQIAGVRYDVPAASTGMYLTRYDRTDFPDGGWGYDQSCYVIPREDVPAGSDIDLLMRGYITVSRIRDLVD